MTWTAILGFRLVTADLDRATAFYAALGFAVERREPIGGNEMTLLGLRGRGTRQALRLGAARVDLDGFEDAGRPYPAGADAAALLFQHLALVTDDAGAAWARAEAAGATPISCGGPVTLPASAGGVTAQKFRDPDGHPLEFLRFPDAMSRGWRGTGLLGIDHSAVSVSEVASSERFYAGHGLVRGDSSLNRGSTQVKLDGLEGVEVDVVALTPPVAATPHLELLGYRHPQGAAGVARRPNDIAATRIVWRAEQAALVRDPDGHLHQQEP